MASMMGELGCPQTAADVSPLVHSRALPLHMVANRVLIEV